MTPNKPYLIRALYDWIVDNALTPYMLVDAEREDVTVPRQYVEQGKIVLNVSPRAVVALSLGNENIEFDARFGGKPMHVCVPTFAVLAIYARENGQGMMFPDESNVPPPPKPTGTDPTTPPPSNVTPISGGKSKKPSLKIVK
jgi:stringent starvation protein B